MVIKTTSNAAKALSRNNRVASNTTQPDGDKDYTSNAAKALSRNNRVARNTTQPDGDKDYFKCNQSTQSKQ